MRRKPSSFHLLDVVVGDADVDAYDDRVRAQGAPVDSEIQLQFGGQRHVAIHDPDGYHRSFAKEDRQLSPRDVAAAPPGA